MIPDGYAAYYLTDHVGSIPQGWHEGPPTAIYYPDLNTTIVTPQDFPNGQRVIVIVKGTSQPGTPIQGKIHCVPRS